MTHKPKCIKILVKMWCPTNFCGFLQKKKINFCGCYWFNSRLS